MVAGFRSTRLVMFNLTGNGTVQQLAPMTGNKQSKVPEPVMIGRPYKADKIAVSEPFGSDHIIAVTGDEATLTALLAEISRYHMTRGVAPMMAALTKAAAQPGIQIGFQGIFTAAN
jgi:hypothetical protein